MNISNLSRQQRNFLQLCEGNPPSKIEFALRLLLKSAQEELKTAFGASSLSDLSIRIAIYLNPNTK